MSVKELAKQTLTLIFVRQMKRIIKKHQPKVIAVVGSVGKTSTKFAIATVVSESYKVLIQSGNYNVPLSIPFIFFERSLPNLYNPFGWLAAWLAGEKRIHGSFPYDVVVVEIGTDKPTDILEFKNILQPDIAVVTAVSDEHMEFFGTVDAVAVEELSISQFSDVVLLNVDDIKARYVNAHIDAAVVKHTYGFSSDEYHIEAQQKPDGYDLRVRVSDSTTVAAPVKLIAKQSLKTAAAAAAVADLLGMDAKSIETGVAKISSPSGRMQLLKGIKNSTIIDDSYNASPLAVAAALQALYDYEAPQRIALLGNMNELGETSQASHEAIAKLCDPKKLDLVVTLGKDSNAYIAPIAEALGCTVLQASSPYEAGGMIADNLKDGGLVLIKGSQNGVFSEEAIKELLADPSDVSLLVRQSDFWLAKKRKQFADAA